MPSTNRLAIMAGIEITIAGAVRRPGRRVLESNTTVAAALLAAGGLMRSRRMWASGAMIIQRAQPGREVEEWHYDMIEQPVSEWGRFALQTGDAVTLQWHIEES
jgi:protein involved in polysaccharide export with SLBB domain